MVGGNTGQRLPALGLRLGAANEAYMKKASKIQGLFYFSNISLLMCGVFVPIFLFWKNFECVLRWW